MSTGHRAPRRGHSIDDWQQRHQSLLAGCGIETAENWDAYVAEVYATRQTAGQSLTRWSAAHLLTALDLAVCGRPGPPITPRTPPARCGGSHDAQPSSRGRVRPLVGPDGHGSTGRTQDLSQLKAELDAVGGLRVQLQRAAREQLTAERHAVTRAGVISRAVELLRNRRRC